MRFLAASFLLSTLPALGQTASERVAMGEAEPTAAQMQARVDACTLPQEGASPVAFNDLTGAALDLPGFTVLPLATVRDGDIGVLEPLPRGGIGAHDICTNLSLHALDETMPAPFGDAVGAVGLWLRPGLDLAKTYPTTADAVEADGRLIELPAGTWILFPTTDETVRQTIAALAASPDTDRSVPAMRLGDLVLARLAD
ncbi:hypothetical protein [Roseobacter sp. HKCCA0434]|uniref:hypothetical protein n=1 Tax=Roseobacter sp. HKCCA0434 TaxID=3079297 RepID=UPI002905D72E|nr:hypothetical protein [Roseobacter sp. HKCCA0434]